MSTSNSIVSFYLLCRKTKSNPKFGLIYLRITVRKQITEFSLKRKIEFEHWNKDLQMSTQKGNQGREINYFLQQSKTKAYEIYNQLKNEGHFITPQLIKNYFLGKASDQKQLMKLIDYHQTKMKNVLAQGTLKNYFTTKNYLIEFLHEELKNSDIYLKQINYKFILDFEYFLRNKDSLNNNGVMKHLERFKKLMNFAHTLEWIDKNPVSKFKLKFNSVDTDYLSEKELKRIEELDLDKPYHQVNRDIFIFSCYTGLAYSDVKSLSRENLMKGINGRNWISFKRKKTEVSVRIPLLKRAQEILNKYKNHPKIKGTDKLLPVYSNQKTNQYIKEVAIIAKIRKKPSFHMARHTFATTVTLANGMPIETVSKMLGHTKLATTQIYARVIDSKIADDFHLLTDKYEEENKKNEQLIKRVN